MKIKIEHQRLEVELGDRSYEISIGFGCRNTLTEHKANLQQDGRKIVALVDNGLSEANPSFINEFVCDLPHLKIPSGEESKSSEWLCRGWDFLASNKIDRTSVIFVFGGGVSGDLGGFLAASYLRGIDFIQVPTTLLSMVDSSVGGKTGINLSAGKNLVGAFHQPSQVIIDLEVLKTLPPREFSAGMAEVIKYGMLGNASLFQKLVSLPQALSPEHPELSAIVHQCCLDKSRIVRDDEKESLIQGGRALLNLGHTFGHAIEATAGYGSYLHGEAVAIGLVCAYRLSCKLGLCENESENVLLELLARYNLPIELTSQLSLDRLLSAMMNDKKVHKGALRFVVMDKIGSSHVENSVDIEVVSEILQSIGAR